MFKKYHTRTDLDEIWKECQKHELLYVHVAEEEQKRIKDFFQKAKPKGKFKGWFILPVNISENSRNDRLWWHITKVFWQQLCSNPFKHLINNLKQPDDIKGELFALLAGFHTNTEQKPIITFHDPQSQLELGHVQHKYIEHIQHLTKNKQVHYVFFSSKFFTEFCSPSHSLYYIFKQFDTQKQVLTLPDRCKSSLLPALENAARQERKKHRKRNQKLFSRQIFKRKIHNMHIFTIFIVIKNYATGFLYKKKALSYLFATLLLLFSLFFLTFSICEVWPSSPSIEVIDHINRSIK